MNKIVLAQIDTIAGDIAYNADKIKNFIEKAKNQNADLIIFPEFALVGYPYGDILTRHKNIIDRQLEALNDIVSSTDNITALVGYMERKIYYFYSSTAVIQNGKILFNARKNDIYNMNKPKMLELNGKKIAISVGEFDIDYFFKLIKQKPDTIINCDCSPSRQGSEYTKNRTFSFLAKEYKINYIYVNKAGYSDNYCFDGSSRIYNKNGELILRAKTFEEDFAAANSDLSGEISNLPVGTEEATDSENFELNYQNDLERTYKSIVFAIKQYFQKNGFTKAVLGLSGGLDSSVCAVLLADALGSENVWGISMPSKITSKESKSDAENLAKNLGIHFMEIPLAAAIEPMKTILNNAFNNIKSEKYDKPTTMENLQARKRATILWSISNEYKGMLPIATSDKSEAYIGYATVNGDMTGGFAPIADVTKTKLFMLADFLNKTRNKKDVIPKSVLEKPPGAELKINPKTGKTVCAEEDNMPYLFLDEIIWLVENKNYGKNELVNHAFLYEKKFAITKDQKEKWINKFYWKSKCAVYKWHIMPPSVIIDSYSINSVEYHRPIISKVY